MNQSKANAMNTGTHEKTDESTGTASQSSSQPVAQESASKHASSAAKGKGKSKSSGEHDNRAVNWSRALVFGVLLTAAAVLSYLTYYYVHQEQMEDFESEFADLAEEIIDTSQLNVKKVFGVLDGLSVGATSQSLHDNVSFPFVTIPNFDQRGAVARTASQALIIAYLPLVSEEHRLDWESYSVEHQDWMEPSGWNTTVQPIRDQIHSYGPKETKAPQEEEEEAPKEDGSHRRHSRRRLNAGASCSAHQRQRMLKERVPEPEGSGPYAPVWQMSPAPPQNNTDIINYNLFDKPVYEKAVSFIGHTRKPSFLDVCDQSAWFGGHFSNKDVLQTVVVEPVFETFDEEAALVGTFVAVIPWQTFFEHIIQSNAPEIRVVLSNTCDEVFTFAIQGSTATFLEEEDLHDPAYDRMGVHSSFAEFANPKELLEADLGEHCVYTVHVYPTKDLEQSYVNDDPIWYCLVVLAVFVFTSMIFLLYDNLVQKRQMRLVEQSAKKHEQIVKSLFPEMVRSRVFDANKEMLELQNDEDDNVDSAFRNEMDGSAADFDVAIDRMNIYKSKPIADLYPSSTVMFADISGFTAWSSIRQPGDVFNLLEMVYHSFDASAKFEKIFKVETIGDCYVAVAGIPEPRDDHAIAMTKFARNCLERFSRVIRKLEQVLGPDTARMQLRVGLHSGPVTGGVLRNAKSRFQLFGDTVNTASRMESTGQPGKIQVSRQTAELLRNGGKEYLLDARTDLVEAKGKGTLETYWIKSKKSSRSDKHQDMSHATDSYSEVYSSDGSEDLETSEHKMEKLVDWNCSMLLPHLKAIVARRQVSKPKRTPSQDLRETEEEISQKYMVRNEVQEIIDLPAYVPGSPEASPNAVKLGEEVKDQLRRYILLLSSLYHQNPFHNFEHASHVAQSTTKLLARIVNAGDDPQTYGISDPLTQFSIILSALLHDANHAGIPNPALIQEDPLLASAYQGKSVAEQQSVDLAWNALMNPEFEALRSCIYCNEKELRRFRQLIVNSVMATDIFDPELSALRKNRWNRVFESSVDVDDASTASMTQEAINRKATLVLEHLIQASDVAHTMQHWKVYLEWNARLFEEMYTAYIHGRTDKDPSFGWYQGEIWFFDNYVLPLGKKLKNCGVFGVSSDEYLNYGVKNRHEWEMRGEKIVADLVAKLSASDDDTFEKSKSGSVWM